MAYNLPLKVVYWKVYCIHRKLFTAEKSRPFQSLLYWNIVCEPEGIESDRFSERN